MFHFLAADIRFVKLNNVKTSFRLKSWLDRVLIFTNVIEKVPFLKTPSTETQEKLMGARETFGRRKIKNFARGFISI